MSGLVGQLVCVLGAQWGDEGKGKMVDLLAREFDIVARFNGGANAGHTLVVDGKKYALHLLPSGILLPTATNIIGNGCVVHIPSLIQEMDQLIARGFVLDGRLLISQRAHIVFDFHKLIDGDQERLRGNKKIGTTKRGIGPTYSAKMNRNGLRFADILNWDHFEARYEALFEALKYSFPDALKDYDAKEELSLYKETYCPRIRSMITSTTLFINKSVKEGKRILAEGANAAMLDIDFGTYPAVTSSNTTIGGIVTGLGIPPKLVGECVGVVKAYSTRVGGGPFPTELFEGHEQGDILCDVGHEYGTTTGRRRRCGWLDIPALQYSTMINGYTSINLTKLDVLNTIKSIKIGIAYKLDGKLLEYGEMPATNDMLSRVEVVYEEHEGWLTDISKCRRFDELPKRAVDYMRRIEELIGVPVKWIGVGPDREETIVVARADIEAEWCVLL